MKNSGSMSLSTKLAPSFTKNVRKRGDDYYCKGRVMIHQGSQSELTARVRGSGFYEVQLPGETTSLQFGATAPILWSRAFLANTCGPPSLLLTSINI
jgi:hypothetical protein